MAEKISSAPSWAATSVSWLEDRFPSYLAGIRSSPAPMRLARALHSMGYQEAEWDAAPTDRSTPKSTLDRMEHRRAMATNWTESDHRAMVKFLDAGGLVARRAEIGAEPEEAGTLPLMTETDENGNTAFTMEPVPDAQETLASRVAGDMAALAEVDERVGAW